MTDELSSIFLSINLIWYIFAYSWARNLELLKFEARYSGKKSQNDVRAKRREKALVISDCRCEAFRWTMTATTITTTSCPARWKAVHSANVSLLIVQVPVQTERLNPRGTNPARKSLSLCVPSRPVYRVYASYFLLHVSVSTHKHVHTAWQRRDLTFECGTGSFCLPRISTGDCSVPSLLPSFPLATLHSCDLVRSWGPEKRCATKIIKSASFRSVCTSRIWPWAHSLNLSSYIQSFSWPPNSIALFSFYIIFIIFPVQHRSSSSFRWFLETSLAYPSTVFNLNFIEISYYILFL